MTTEEPDPQHLRISKQRKKNPHGMAMAETLQPPSVVDSRDNRVPT
jgi:hypothetical protein